jgi:hypothetical protein
MKFRPQVTLRLRDEGQWKGMVAQAEKEGVSLNEWLLERVEREVGYERQAPQVPRHDPRTCRIYGCLMCAALKAGK